MKKEEIVAIILALVVLSFSAALTEFDSASLNSFLNAASSIVIILFVTISIKKAVAYKFDATETTRIWNIQRYGVAPGSHFNAKIPIGIILPILFSILSLGKLPWYGVLESEIDSSKYRSSRRQGYFSRVELKETHIAIISSMGIISSIGLGIIALVFGQPVLARLSIQYAFFNILPLGGLDGCQVFFSNRYLWMLLGVLTLILTFFSFLV